MSRVVSVRNSSRVYPKSRQADALTSRMGPSGACTITASSIPSKRALARRSEATSARSICTCSVTSWSVPRRPTTPPPIVVIEAFLDDHVQPPPVLRQERPLGGHLPPGTGRVPPRNFSATARRSPSRNSSGTRSAIGTPQQLVAPIAEHLAAGPVDPDDGPRLVDLVVADGGLVIQPTESLLRVAQRGLHPLAFADVGDEGEVADRHAPLVAIEVDGHLDGDEPPVLASVLLLVARRLPGGADLGQGAIGDGSRHTSGSGPRSSASRPHPPSSRSAPRTPGSPGRSARRNRPPRSAGRSGRTRDR